MKELYKLKKTILKAHKKKLSKRHTYKRQFGSEYENKKKV
jgi:hypothetical protein